MISSVRTRRLTSPYKITNSNQCPSRIRLFCINTDFCLSLDWCTFHPNVGRWQSRQRVDELKGAPNLHIKKIVCWSNILIGQSTTRAWHRRYVDSRWCSICCPFNSVFFRTAPYVSKQISADVWRVCGKSPSIQCFLEHNSWLWLVICMYIYIYIYGKMYIPMICSSQLMVLFHENRHIIKSIYLYRKP